MVAACISAETGVGPAMASGSQVYSGICALLPIAPTKSSRQMSEIMPLLGRALPLRTAAKMPEKSAVPKWLNNKKTAKSKPKSPMRFIINALRAATP